MSKLGSAVRGVGLGVAGFLMVAAKGNGCAAELQPGDGSAAAWEMAPIPTAKGADLPMSCEWLEGPNCWKEFVADVVACAPKGTGTFNDDRDTCAYPDGGELELEGPISAPASGTTLYPIVEHRLLDAAGKPCFTAKILGVGHGAYGLPDRTVVLQSSSLTNYRVICADGSSYSNAVEGTCPEFGAKWLAKAAPGYKFTCDGTTDECKLELWGASNNAAVDVGVCE